MNDPITLTSAFIIGLLGGVHCIGMCGGIMNALSFAIPADQKSSIHVTSILLLYNLGRILSYSIAGALIGSLGWWLQGSTPLAGPSLRIFAGLMLIAMGLYLAGWWRGLAMLEKLGGKLWQRIQPVSKQLMPVTHSWQALVLGAIWGWLPCGLVYSTLTLAATSGNWQQSALVMACFGLGTLPVMLLTGTFAHQVKIWIQKTAIRVLAALMIIGFGIWTMTPPLLHGKHEHTQSDAPASTNSHEHQH